MADPATMMAVGTAVQAGQGIASGAAGKRAGQKLDNSMNQHDERLGGLMDMAGDMTGRMFAGGSPGFNMRGGVSQTGMVQHTGMPGGNPMLANVLGPVGAERNPFNATSEMQHTGVGGRVVGDPSTYAPHELGGMSQHAGMPGGQFFGADQLMERAIHGGDQLSGDLTGIANQMGGVAGAMQGIGDGGAGGYGQMLANDPGAQFNFAPGSNMMDQSMAAFQNISGNVRNQAADQAAQAFTQGGGALDAALASRGISRGSGVAAGATRDMAVQGAQQLAGVERDLANMGSQMGLDATQFDVGRVLQEQGMQSNFALGQAGQRSQNLLGAGNLSLGSASQQLNNLSQAGNMMGNQANIMGNAYAMPLGMQQDMFSQNFMNPHMQQQQLMSGFAQNLMGMGMSGYENMMNMRNQQTQQAGAGKGAAMGGMTDPARASAKQS